jgi:hypothetical protein
MHQRECRANSWVTDNQLSKSRNAAFVPTDLVVDSIAIPKQAFPAVRLADLS